MVGCGWDVVTDGGDDSWVSRFKVSDLQTIGNIPLTMANDSWVPRF